MREKKYPGDGGNPQYQIGNCQAVLFLSGSIEAGSGRKPAASPRQSAEVVRFRTECGSIKQYETFFCMDFPFRY